MALSAQAQPSRAFRRLLISAAARAVMVCLLFEPVELQVEVGDDVLLLLGEPGGVGLADAEGDALAQGVEVLDALFRPRIHFAAVAAHLLYVAGGAALVVELLADLRVGGGHGYRGGEGKQQGWGKD